MGERKMIRGLKLLLGLIAIAGLFILFMATAITSVPYFTGKHYTHNEAPSSLFYIVLESFNPHLNRLQFQCLRWNDFQKIFPQNTNINVYRCRETDAECDYPIVPDWEYRAILSVPEGACDNMASGFKVQHLEHHAQVVRLRWSLEAFKVRNSYRVDGHGVSPLHSVKFMSAGICISIFLLMVIALPVMVIFFHFCLKKYGKLIVAGWALIWVGVCAFNFAVFNQRLNLDPFSENPAIFFYRSKMSTLVAVLLFSCAAISFWLHKKKSLAARKPG